MDEFLSAGQAAAILDMPYPTLVSHINKGNLQAQRFGPNYAISKTDLIQFKVGYDRGDFSGRKHTLADERARLERIAHEVSLAVGGAQK